ncbi:MAG: hypothetical protein OEM00_01425 [Burkholderiaceae bacterium]|nr:hypothetical protein [Burkholderiaceae bacterium]MDH3459642.1 hypothetical protein [Burkholderiaceae bacterium]
MARIAYAPTQSPQQAQVHLALLPRESETGNGWSIDQEPMMSSGWHDSSWMLRKGLDVIEGVVLEPVPMEWRRQWRLSLCTGECKDFWA